MFKSTANVLVKTFDFVQSLGDLIDGGPLCRCKLDHIECDGPWGSSKFLDTALQFAVVILKHSNLPAEIYRIAKVRG